MNILNTSPFSHSAHSVQKAMMQVQIAAIPAMLTHIYFFGWGITIQWTLAVITALVVESIMLKLRGRPIKPYLTDFSALITVTGLVFCLPPEAPWWVVVSGSAFALIFGKHLYGGLGYNPFNPAMLGFAFLLISFPAQMSVWTLPSSVSGVHLDFMHSIDLIFFGTTAGIALDAITGATPLGFVKTQVASSGGIGDSLGSTIFNSLELGAGWAWVNLAFFVGGLWMLYTRSIRWHFPVAFLGSLALMAFIFHEIDPTKYASVSFHLFSGGTMLAAFFIITDPVTASTTPRGRLVYAAGIGVLLYVIRNWGAFPDGIAFAILIMNMCVPLIDQYTQPRVFGHGLVRK
ncbi:electron transport complex subunit RsxD [Thiosulfativibrio zosterae]|uniref:Ion-translocating oxidoreductase complex subunit D n=1 Tax=Thiosulfativibrio zosterae TaxID=2675053 RepID=A0A6F8PMV8_9GAMM|nr:electron transport complex subunit RsxD [Thiosulfativibrio zosterae]BBP43377.1 electron transport complex subunit RsxD [Thiosulfativibrio zosterae]